MTCSLVPFTLGTARQRAVVAKRTGKTWSNNLEKCNESRSSPGFITMMAREWGVRGTFVSNAEKDFPATQRFG
jgi:hypothetical protein